MFRFTEDPSSGSFVQCLAKNYKNDSIVSVDMDVVGVMAAYCDKKCVLFSELVLWQHIVTRSVCCSVNCTHGHLVRVWWSFKYFIILIVSKIMYCVLVG